MSHYQREIGNFDKRGRDTKFKFKMNYYNLNL